MAEGPDEIRERAMMRDQNPTSDEMDELKRRAQSNDEVEATRAQIELTRLEMGETVDELQEKLEPEKLKEQAREKAKEAARSAGSDFVETLRQNPMPVAIIGGLLGLVILSRLLSGEGEERRGSADTVVFDLRKGRVRVG